MKLLICRTIIIYLCVLFAMRLMGKRQLGELQPEEILLLIGSETEDYFLLKKEDRHGSGSR